MWTAVAQKEVSRGDSMWLSRSARRVAPAVPWSVLWVQCAMEGAVFDGTWIPSRHEATLRYEVPKPQCVTQSALCFMVPRSQCAVEGDG